MGINWDGTTIDETTLSPVEQAQQRLSNIPFDSYYPTAAESEQNLKDNITVWNSQGPMTDTPEGPMSWSAISNLYSSPTGITRYPWLEGVYRKGQKEGNLAQTHGAEGGGFFGSFAPLLALGAGVYFGMPSLEGLFGSGLTGGAISSEAAAAGMGAGIDVAGWGSGALDSIGFNNVLQGLDMATPAFSSPEGWQQMSNYLNPSAVDYGIQSPVTTPYTPDFGNMVDAQSAIDTSQNPDLWNEYGATPTGSAAPMDTLGSTNKLSSLLNTLKQGGLRSMDLSQIFKQPSTADMVWSGVKALGSMYSNNQAQDAYKRAFDQINNDPNRARGNVANQLWMDNWQNPTAMYNTFMQGAGRDFVNQARALAAKNGSRGSYINSGRLNSDLAGLFAKQQVANSNAIAGGFDNINPGSTIAQLTPGYAALQANSLAPIGQAVDSVLRKQELADLFGG